MQYAAFQRQTIVRPDRRMPVLLGLSLALVALLCFAQSQGSMSLIALILFSFLLLTIIAVGWGRALGLFLFFLPWSPLLKLYQGGISFYTVAILLACVIQFVRGSGKLRPYQVFCTALVVSLTLIAKAIQGNSLSMSYLFFIAMLFLFPRLADQDSHECTFFELTVFFALGIISAALTAREIAGFPRISQFVRVDSYLTITRLSGFYGDPNFYSTHISACFAGIQLLLVRETKVVSRMFLSVLAVVLIFCGLLSASKSFVVVLACQFFVWVLILMEKNNRASVRVRVLIGVLVAVLIMLSSSAVKNLLEIIDTRFSYAANASQITTGRTTLWKAYVHELVHNPVLLLMGEGFSDVTINGRASHNTFLQGVYQFGIICFPILLVWLGNLLKNVHTDGKELLNKKMSLLLMLTGVMLPWMGLDMLFFDEFFFLPVYMLLGSRT